MTNTDRQTDRRTHKLTTPQRVGNIYGFITKAAECNGRNERVEVVLVNHNRSNKKKNVVHSDRQTEGRTDIGPLL